MIILHRVNDFPLFAKASEWLEDILLLSLLASFYKILTILVTVDKNPDAQRFLIWVLNVNKA